MLVDFCFLGDFRATQPVQTIALKQLLSPRLGYAMRLKISLKGLQAAAENCESRTFDGDTAEETERNVINGTAEREKRISIILMKLVNY